MKYHVQLPSIDQHRVNVNRHSSQTEAMPTVDINQQPNYGQRTPEYDIQSLLFISRLLKDIFLLGKRKKVKVPTHLRKKSTDKEIGSFTKRVLRIPEDVQFDEAYYTHMLWMFSERVERQKGT